MLTEILEWLSQTDFPKTQFTSTSRLLFDIQMWLIQKRCLVDVIPIDSWDSWVYRVTVEDCMGPFFVASECDTEYPTYESALEAGILYALKHNICTVTS